MNQADKRDAFLITTSIFTVLIAFWLLGGLLSGKQVNKASDPSCEARYAELGIVSDIASATGKLPGVPQTATPGTKFSVNPNFCKR
jgi:hypothetical protein